MKTITTKLYSFSELSPEAKDRVIKNRITEAENDSDLLDHTAGEIVDSIRKFAEACGYTLQDWSISAYSRNNKVRISGGDELDGRRALAHVLRALLSHGYARPKRFAEMTFPGVCGITGVCFDDDMIESVWNDLREGESLYRAFCHLADKAGDILEKENEYLTSREAIMETLDESEEIYTENGEVF